MRVGVVHPRKILTKMGVSQEVPIVVPLNSLEVKDHLHVQKITALYNLMKKMIILGYCLLVQSLTNIINKNLS